MRGMPAPESNCSYTVKSNVFQLGILNITSFANHGLRSKEMLTFEKNFSSMCYFKVCKKIFIIYSKLYSIALPRGT